MDASIGWYQPEQKGHALTLWTRVWEAQQGIENLNLDKDKSDICDMSNIQDNGTPIDMGLSKQILNGGCRRVQHPHLNTIVPLCFSQQSRNRRPAREDGFSQCVSQRFLNSSIREDDTNHLRDCPWRKRPSYSSGITGLHEEIEDFYDYAHHSPAEHRMRSDVVHRIQRVIRDLWPHARVEIFGSFRTGLYLPTSDIDLVVIGKWDSLPLQRLGKELLKNKITDSASLKVLDKASVPIVKLTDLENNIKVDISFNMSNGVLSAKLIKDFKKEFPALPKLVLVLKQFLLQRDLNEVFTGGISSYSLILLTVSFFQLHAGSEGRSPSPNLARLLLQFFQLYGRQFHYLNTGIRIKDGGAYISKEEVQKDMVDGHRPSLLCIEDPLTAGNDIGRSSYGALKVKTAFEMAHIELTKAVNPVMSHIYDNNKHSILGRIVRIDEEIQNYRCKIEKKYSPGDSPSPPYSDSSVSDDTDSGEVNGLSRENSPRHVNLPSLRTDVKSAHGNYVQGSHENKLVKETRTSSPRYCRGGRRKR